MAVLGIQFGPCCSCNMGLGENWHPLLSFLYRRDCNRNGGLLDQVAVQTLCHGFIVYRLGRLESAIEWQDTRQTALLDSELMLLGVFCLLFLENGRYRGNCSRTGMGKRKVASKELAASIDGDAKKK